MPFNKIATSLCSFFCLLCAQGNQILNTFQLGRLTASKINSLNASFPFYSICHPRAEQRQGWAEAWANQSQQVPTGPQFLSGSAVS